MSMYVRVKRDKLTVFLHVDATDTVSTLKQSLQELLHKPAEDLQLYKGDAVLEDGKSLAEQRVENDDELAVAFRIEGGQFEAVHIERFDQGTAKDDPTA